MGAGVVLGLGVAGLAVGFVAGLIGIGGGVLMVPLLYAFYERPGWAGALLPPELAPVVAHATSLFVIVPTAIKGVISYQRAKLVPWRVALPVALAATFAAVLGARLALELPGPALKLAFGLLVVASGVQIGVGRGRPQDRPLRAGLPTLSGIGLVVGLTSALLGVGGGVVAIPLLTNVVGLDLQRVTATSLSIMAFASLAGTATYIAGGLGVDGLPPGNLGYVHLWAALPLVAGSLLAVGWGARLNRRLPVRKLRWVFAVAFILIGMRLVVQNARVMF